MLTDEQSLDQHVKALLFDLMLVLYTYGIKEVNLGALMRILGVSEEKAREHDDEAVELTDEFAKYVEEARNIKRPENTTLH